MLFDPRVKSRKEDLFDRRKEIKALKNSIKRYQITLVLGIRGVGKSSLLNVILNSIQNGIYIDAKKLYFDSGGWVTNKALLKAFENSLNSLAHPTRREVFQYLKRVKGVSISEFHLNFESKVSLSDILEALNEYGKIIIAFDEAQYLRFYGRRGGKELLTLIAYAYENLPNISFIFTTSEIGLLHDFIGFSNNESPLCGKTYNEIIISSFSRELSVEFLTEGFIELGIPITEEEIETIVDVLGGIPRWLVEFGYCYSITKNSKTAIKEVFFNARRKLDIEFRELNKRTLKYLLVLQAIALGFNTWGLVERFLMAHNQKTPSSRLAAILKNLQKMCWIKAEDSGHKKIYRIIDPVVERVLKEYFNF